MHVATKLMHSHELAGRIRVDHRAKEVKGFFVAIDPKHVEWRLQDALDSRSADFLHAAWCLRAVFSKIFNITDAPPVDGEDPLASSSERLDWQLLWKAWLTNEPVLRRTCNGQDMVTAYKKALDGDVVEASKFRGDGCRPPRALVYNFLGLLKSDWASRAALWEGQSKEELYQDELACVSKWFAVPMVPWRKKDPKF